jgi:hypothetical protein
LFTQHWGRGNKQDMTVGHHKAGSGSHYGDDSNIVAEADSPHALTALTVSGPVAFIAHETTAGSAPKAGVRLRKLFDDVNLSIPLSYSGHSIGMIHVDGMPDDAIEGSLVTVETEVSIGQQQQVDGIVQVTTPAGRVAKEAPFHIAFSLPAAPDIPTLNALFDDLCERVQQEAVRCESDSAPNSKSEMRLHLDRIGALFRVESPDAALIQMTLHELSIRLDKSEVLALSVRQNLAKCRLLLSGQAKTEQSRVWQMFLDRVDAEAELALAGVDTQKLASVADALERAQTLIEANRDREKPLPPTRVQKEQEKMCVIEALRAEIDETEEDVAESPEHEAVLRSRIESLRTEIEARERAVDAVPDDMPPGEAYQRIRYAFADVGLLHLRISAVANRRDTCSIEEYRRQDGFLAGRWRDAALMAARSHCLTTNLNRAIKPNESCLLADELQQVVGRFKIPSDEWIKRHVHRRQGAG